MRDIDMSLVPTPEDVSKRTARIRHILKHIDRSVLSANQEEWLLKLYDSYFDRGTLSDKQMDVLEEIFKKANEGEGGGDFSLDSGSMDEYGYSGRHKQRYNESYQPLKGEFKWQHRQ